MELKTLSKDAMKTSLKELEAALSLYGSDLKRWPEPLRSAGRAALATDAAFREAVSKEAQFEALLREADSADKPDRFLSQRIIMRARTTEQQAKRGSLLSFSMPAWVWGAAAVLVWSAGFVGGWVVFRASPETRGQQPVLVSYYHLGNNQQ